MLGGIGMIIPSQAIIALSDKNPRLGLQLPYKQKFQIKGKDLYHLIGYNSKDTATLKEALLGLITIAIEWNVIDCSTGQEKKWKASSILASAELSNGICVYEYSQMMKDLLYQPEIYGKIDIELISKFKSTYGLALYENCIRYNGLNQTPWFPLEIFRKLMGVFDNKYTAFKDFKKRVVDIAVREVNTISSINILPEMERINQKVMKIRFKLEKNKKFDVTTIKIPIDSGLDAKLTEIFGLSNQMKEEVLSKYDEKYIQEKTNIIIQSDSFIQGKIRKLAGYLIEALKKDYKPGKSSKVITNELRRQKEENDKIRIFKEQNRLDRYNIYFTNKIESYISKLSKNEYSTLVAEFNDWSQNNNKFLYTLYKKHGFDHAAAKGDFNNFVLEARKQQIGEILSKEDFITLIEDNN